MAGSLTISGLSAGEPAGQRTFGPLTIQGSTIVGETLEVLLASGDNTFAIPTGSTAVLIVPPANGSATLKLRTSSNSGDTGLPISITFPSVYSLPSTVPTSLIVNASGSETAALALSFI